MAKNEVQKTDSYDVSIAAEFGFDTEQNLAGGEEVTLEKVKILKDACQFQKETGECVESMTGYIIYKQRVNAWWENDYSSDSNEPPDCFSKDGIEPSSGDNVQAQKCEDCPQNQFGSAKVGEGKACSNKTSLGILLDDETLPVMLQLPPTSLKSFGRYMRVLFAKGVPFQVAKTTFTLKSGSNAAIAQFEMVEACQDKEMLLALKSAVANCKVVMGNAQPTSDGGEEPATEGTSTDKDATGF